MHTYLYIQVHIKTPDLVHVLFWSLELIQWLDTWKAQKVKKIHEGCSVGIFFQTCMDSGRNMTIIYNHDLFTVDELKPQSFA